MSKIGVIHGFASRRVPDLDHLLIETYSDEYPVTITSRDILAS